MRFRYVLPYLRVFLEGSRSYNVIMGGFHPGASGVMCSGRSRSVEGALKDGEQLLRVCRAFELSRSAEVVLSSV